MGASQFKMHGCPGHLWSSDEEQKNGGFLTTWETVKSTPDSFTVRLGRSHDT